MDFKPVKEKREGIMAEENSSRKKNQEKELQDRYMEFQVLEQQLRQLQADLQNVDMQLLEVKSMQNAVSEIEKIKPGSEALVPIANGMFVKGSIAENKTILVNVGSNVVVDKTVSETIALLEKQIQEMSSVRQQFLHEMEKLGSKMQAVEQDMQKLVSEG